MKYRFYLSLCFIVMVLSMVMIPTVAQESNFTSVCVENYDPDVDYFPEKVEIQYAEGFAVEYFNHYKVVTILQPWQNAQETFQYLLLQCGTPAPAGYEDTLIIEIPVNRFISLSTSFTPYLDAQNLLDKLVGMDSFLYTNNANVIEKIAAGELAEVGGGGGGEMNIEVIIDLAPDLIMMQQFSAQGSGSREVLSQAGLNVVLNADFVDTTPLGRAEWGKYIALFFNTEGLAQEQFEGVSSRYLTLAELAANADEQPTVFVNTPYDGTWFMAGGKSYLAQFLADAGALYLWAEDNSLGSLFLDFETVYDVAANADFWVNANPFWSDTNSALAEDSRYGDFAALKNGKVYNYNARMNANGGMDYFESGYANPDLVLADLIKIFHPDLMPEHTFVYYQNLPQ